MKDIKEFLAKNPYKKFYEMTNTTKIKNLINCASWSDKAQKTRNHLFTFPGFCRIAAFYRVEGTMKLNVCLQGLEA